MKNRRIIKPMYFCSVFFIYTPRLEIISSAESYTIQQLYSIYTG